MQVFKIKQGADRCGVIAVIKIALRFRDQFNRQIAMFPQLLRDLPEIRQCSLRRTRRALLSRKHPEDRGRVVSVFER